MQISQTDFFHLCYASALAGLALGFLYDLLYITQLWALPSNHRYTIPKIQRLLSSRKAKHKQSSILHAFRLMRFIGDVFFCLASALVTILLLYCFNNGNFRAITPICMAICFLGWHIYLSKRVRCLLEWLAFFIETVVHIILKPIKYVFYRIAKSYKNHIAKQQFQLLCKQRQKHTKQTLQNINKTIEKLTFNRIK